MAPSKGFIERTTVHEGEGSWTIPEDAPTQHHFVAGAPKDEAGRLELARALFDEIAAERTKTARAQESS